jgi:hypothetical protein
MGGSRCSGRLPSCSDGVMHLTHVDLPLWASINPGCVTHHDPGKGNQLQHRSNAKRSNDRHHRHELGSSLFPASLTMTRHWWMVPPAGPGTGHGPAPSPLSRLCSQVGTSLDPSAAEAALPHLPQAAWAPHTRGSIRGPLYPDTTAPPLPPTHQRLQAMACVLHQHPAAPPPPAHSRPPRTRTGTRGPPCLPLGLGGGGRGGALLGGRQAVPEQQGPGPGLWSRLAPPQAEGSPRWDGGGREGGRRWRGGRRGHRGQRRQAAGNTKRQSRLLLLSRI